MSDRKAPPKGSPPAGRNVPPRSFRSAAWVALVAVLLLLLLAGSKRFRDLQALREVEAGLTARIAEARIRVAEAERTVRGLEDDPATLERLAREELGWAYPGEIVIVVPVQASP